MSTNIRPEISEKSKYWISKHRYYELKHYCMQYPEWQQDLWRLKDYILHSRIPCCQHDTNAADPTADVAIAIANLEKRMANIKKLCKEADADLWAYIFEGVVHNRSFTYLKTALEIPCEKGMYYDRYRKFFWLLSERRDT